MTDCHTYLVTGGAGFIGSHFVRTLRQKNPQATVIVYDALTYAADLRRLSGVDVQLVTGDICDKVGLEAVFSKYPITRVVHFAAETHVDRSSVDDAPFIRTNILGTHTLLQVAMSHWHTDAAGYSGKRFLHMSTDEVYGAVLPEATPRTEQHPLSPSNPYAATKAAADQLVLGAINRGRFPACIIRSSNVYGANQHPEKLIPKAMQCLQVHAPIPLYGDGAQKRCWLAVEDLCEALYTVLEAPTPAPDPECPPSIVPEGVTEAASIFNVKGDEVLSNRALLSMLHDAYTAVTGVAASEIAPIVLVPDRLYHDTFYNMSDHTFRHRFGWTPKKRLLDFFHAHFSEEAACRQDF